MHFALHNALHLTLHCTQTALAAHCTALNYATLSIALYRQLHIFLRQTLKQTTALTLPLLKYIALQCAGWSQDDLLGMCRDSLRLIKLHWNALKSTTMQIAAMRSSVIQCNAKNWQNISEIQCVILLWSAMHLGGLIYRDRGGGLITGINCSIQLPPYQVMDHLNLDLRFLQ